MEREPDVELKISLRAEEVRFERKPDVEVRAYADSPATAGHAVCRETLRAASSDAGGTAAAAPRQGHAARRGARRLAPVSAGVGR